MHHAPRRILAPAVSSTLVLGLVVSLLFIGITPRSVSAGAGEAPAGPARAAAQVLAAGAAHSCAIVESGPGPGGDVQCWGSNFYGQLGQGDQISRGDQPDEIIGLPSVNLGAKATAVTAGRNHTCALLVGGSVKCWGMNSRGQLGLGDLNNRGDGPNEMGASLPAVALGTGRTATMIAAGDEFTCAVLDTSAIKCWGENADGQLGLGDTADRGDQPGEMGDSLGSVPVGGNTDIRSFAVGANHACVIITETLRCWGDNSAGQLGVGSTVDVGATPGAIGPAQLPAGSQVFVPLLVTAGLAHTCAADASRVLCWGSNSDGQLGRGVVGQNRGDQANETAEGLTPFAMATGSEGGQVSALAAGQNSTCVFGSGSLRCWGDNQFGQLGLDSATDRGDPDFVLGLASSAVIGTQVLAVASGHYHVCYAVDGRKVRCFGANNAGQLGIGATDNRGDGPGETAAVAAVPLQEGFPVKAVAVATYHACALGENGQVKCWGRNTSGQLGNGNSLNVGATLASLENLQAVNLGTGRTAKAIAAGGESTCAILDNDTLKCWGLNSSGQLGIGGTASRGADPAQMGDALPIVALGFPAVPTRVSVGSTHACALRSNGEVKCWGSNNFGQLGQGDTARRGDGPNEMGDFLSPISLGTALTAKAVVAGDSTTCAVLNTNAVKCWGEGGLLGTGDVVTRGDQAGEMGNSLPVTPLGTGRTSTGIDGDSTTCVVLDISQVMCFGANIIGAAGAKIVGTVGDVPGEVGLAPAEMGTGRSVVQVSSAGANSCALLDDQTVKCWGNGSNGVRGIDNFEQDGFSSVGMGDLLPAAKLPTGYVPASVSVGGGFVCITTTLKRVLCWGKNNEGQLGRGDTVDIGTPTTPMSQIKPVALAGAPRLLLNVPVVAGRPSQPWDLQWLSSPTPGSAVLEWRAPTADNGAQVTGYRIEVSTDQSNFTTVVANTGVTAAINEYTVTGLTPLVAHYFRVRAVNAVGVGPFLANMGPLTPQAPPPPPPPPPPAGSADYVPVSPFRLADTRPDGETGDDVGEKTGLVAAGSVLTVQVTGRGGVPAGAAAAVLNVIATQTEGSGFLTVFPCDQGRPLASNVNYVAGQTVPNAVVSKLASDGSVCVFSLAGTHVVVDVNGAYPAGGSFVPLAPFRLADSRPDGETGDDIGEKTGLVPAGGVLAVQVTGRGGVPSGAAAAVLNVTATQTQAAGFLTVFPCDQGRPLASNVNYVAGQTVPNAVVSKLAADGTVCIFSLAPTHVIVDVNGAFPAGSGFVPVSPFRLADTRPDGETGDDVGEKTGLVAAGGVLGVQVTGRGGVPGGSKAAVLNVTATQAQGSGFLTVFPCDEGRPLASNVNYVAGQTVPNAVVTKLAADGRVCIFSLAATHVIIDVNGAS